MRIFLTGGTGFVGSRAAWWLHARGHQVVALCREESDVAHLQELGVQIHRGHLADAEALGAGIAGCDAVVHLAEATQARHEAELLSVNGRGTGRLARAAAEATPALKRLVYVSSMAASGPAESPDTPRCESDPPQPQGPYGRSKLDGERRVLEVAQRVPVTILRPPVTYGPRDRDVIHFFRLARRRMLPVLGPGESRVSLLFVDDLCEAIGACLDRPHPTGSVFFLDDGQARSWPEIGREIAKAVGVQGKAVRVPGWVLAWAGRRQRAGSRATAPAALHPASVAKMRHNPWVCSSAAIRETLGWEPRTPFPAGVRATADWCRAQGWL